MSISSILDPICRHSWASTGSIRRGGWNIDMLACVCINKLPGRVCVTQTEVQIGRARTRAVVGPPWVQTNSSQWQLRRPVSWAPREGGGAGDRASSRSHFPPPPPLRALGSGAAVGHKHKAGLSPSLVTFWTLVKSHQTLGLHFLFKKNGLLTTYSWRLAWKIS